MKYLAPLALLLTLGCTSDQGAVVGPSAPTLPQPISSSDPGATPSPSPQTRGEGVSWVLVSSGNRWSVALTNNNRVPQSVFVACYTDPDRDVATQKLHEPATTSILDPGATKTLSAALPCGKWQCDAVEGISASVPKTSPFFGSNLIVGRIGTHRGGVCEPPPPPDCVNCPPPPVCDVAALNTENAVAEALCEQSQGIYTFELDEKACTFTSTCDPPVCNVSDLARKADAACEFDFKLDVMACTYKCLPPPECNLFELRKDAKKECGVDNFKINERDCSFKCLPPPVCDAKELLVEATKECGSLEVKSVDFDACTFECNPPPVCDPDDFLKEARKTCGHSHLVDEIDYKKCVFTCHPNPPQDLCHVKSNGDLEQLLGIIEPEYSSHRHHDNDYDGLCKVKSKKKSKKSDKSDKSEKKVYVCHVKKSGKDKTLKLKPKDVFEHVPGHSKDYMGKCHK